MSTGVGEEKTTISFLGKSVLYETLAVPFMRSCCRLRSKGMGFVRPIESIGSYTMLLKHHKSAALNPRR